MGVKIGLRHVRITLKLFREKAPFKKSMTIIANLSLHVRHDSLLLLRFQVHKSDVESRGCVRFD